jgi:hypothetical protein
VYYFVFDDLAVSGHGLAPIAVDCSCGCLFSRNTALQDSEVHGISQRGSVGIFKLCEEN